VSADNPYAAPKTQVRRVVVHHPTGGLNRLHYFLASLGLNVVTMGLLSLFAWPLMKGMMELKGFGAEANAQAEALMESTGRNVIIGAIGVYFLSFVVSIWFLVLRNRNIGWPWPYVFFTLVPLVNIWYTFALLAYPPGYARHRRFDTATKVLLGVIVAFVLLMVAIVVIAGRKAPGKMDESKPASVEDVSRSAAEAARRNPAGSNP
jgi:predicted ferric reductase